MHPEFFGGALTGLIANKEEIIYQGKLSDTEE